MENEVGKINQDPSDGEIGVENKFLTFCIADEHYGFEIEYVTEIIGVLEITPLPDTEAYIKGVINLREKIIPVMDIRKRFEMEEKDYDEKTCIVVIKFEEIEMGLLVDTVSEVINLPNDRIESSATIHSKSKSEFIKGIGKGADKPILLIDIGHVVLAGEELVKPELKVA